MPQSYASYRRATSGRTLRAERQRAAIADRTANQQFRRDSRTSRQLHNQEQNAYFRANNQYKQRIKTERGNGLAVFDKVADVGKFGVNAYLNQQNEEGSPDMGTLATLKYGKYFV
jgi:hypothetical protein